MGKPTAEEVLPKVLAMVDSDLMGAVYYLKKAMEVAIVAKDIPKATRIGEFYVELEQLSKMFSNYVAPKKPNKEGK